ncbi:hypothetical protein [Microbacterium aurantiacum]|uniref:Uncharacterized protein n=1 Tax=Microbacterium aurantiacum TaxID=162393 RepID=A0AAJ2LWW2_9MICO|nr:hypothetical protein [Microbacterium aurantiacum]MDS0246162.1 hypothetical protein [Microbacterium aurantiacum]
MPILQSVDGAVVPAMPDEPRADPGSRRIGIRFWLRRYLPAEIAGTAALVLAGLAVAETSAHPVVVTAAAVIGENLGFYGVLAVVVLVEQRRRGRKGARAIAAIVVLLAAEFGAAELLDSLLVRPGAIAVALWLVPEPFWALLVGKVAADLVFYAIAAVGYIMTTKTHLRRPVDDRGSGESPARSQAKALP